MSPRTEELLYVLLWTADMFMRPTWRNLNDSFEQWTWRNRLSRRIEELERAKLLERHPEPNLERVVRLTAEGRLRALGGRDPIEQWARPWDGQWRLVLFDLPTLQQSLRRRLLRTLHRGYFGYLQHSVWITPDATVAVRARLDDVKMQPDAFLVIEGRPAAGESDAEIVQAAWNFTAINRRYHAYTEFVRQGLPAADRLMAWARRENALWTAAVRTDPLLPARLQPPAYRGGEAFELRRELLSQLAKRA
jgi:phenylacetic acid degradation operon negative regulatory protein